MALYPYSEENRENLEIRLADIGKSLAKLPSSNGELIALLETTETILCDVWQAPPKSTADALIPTTQAIVADELLRHSDEDVQVMVASCLSEITRITVPDAPYPDELMKEVFQLFMVTLQHLHSWNRRKYHRAVWVLTAIAQVRYCLIMLDLQLDAMVVDMFQLFFDALRSFQPPNVIESMEMIMTLVINEIEEVSVELLTPLLDSVKMENKKTSPVAWELGKTVFEKCANQLQDYLREAVKLLNLDVNDYADIVATICNGTSNEENMVVEEVVAAGSSGDEVSGERVSKLKGIAEADKENSSPQPNNGNENTLDNENSTETFRCSQQIVQLDCDNALPDTEVVNIAETGQPGTETGEFRRIRSRRPNTLMRPEEGYEHSWMLGWITRPRSRAYRKQSMMILNHDPEQSTKPRRKIRKSGIKEMGSRTPKKMQQGEGTSGGSKEINDEIIFQEPKAESGEDKMMGSPVSKPPSEYLAPEKKKKSRKSGVHYGEELVNARISVKPRKKIWKSGVKETGSKTPKTMEKREGTHNGRKEVNDEIISQVPDLEDDRDKMAGSPVSKSPFEYSASEKEKKSQKSGVHYGKELVNARISVKPRKKIRKAGVKKTGTKTPKNTEKGEHAHIGTNSDDKAEVLLQERSGRKEINDEIISQEPELEDDGDKMVGSPVSKSTSEDSVPEKEKKSGKSSVHFGDELVNERISAKPRRKIRKSGLKEAGNKMPKKTEKGKGADSGTHSNDKAEFLLKRVSGRKEINDGIISQEPESEDDGDKMVGSPVSKSASEDSAPEKEKKSGKSSLHYWEELVNARISVKPRSKARKPGEKETGNKMPKEMEKGEGTHSRRKEINEGIIPQEPESKDDEDKMVRSPVSKSTSEYSAPEKKKSPKSRVCYGEELINARIPAKPRRKIRKSGVSETGTKISKNMDKGEHTHSGTDSDDKAEFLLQKPSGRQEINDEIISQEPESKDDEDKMVGSPGSKSTSEDSASEQEKKSQKSTVHYGVELVNARISVWWPLDQAFYTGTVESFDPLTKKHKIKYDDDEEEILNLEEEKWEFFEDRKLCQMQTSSKQEADDPSCPEKPIKTEKKSSKRKAGSKPQRAASSSKRSKTEGHSFPKSGKSPFRYINLNEDSDDDSF